MKHWILDDEGNPAEEPDLIKWSMWFESAYDKRHVGDDEIDDVRISTVFLGIDHNYSDDGPPILFETIIFGGEHDEFQKRYATRELALDGHQRTVEMVKGKADE